MTSDNPKPVHSTFVRGLARPGKRVPAALAGLALAHMASLAPATADDAGLGRALAETWCANCHLIGPDRVGSDSAPPFTAIAADPDKDADHLRVWLATPHPRMPSMPLSRRDIDNLVAYIGSLAP